MGAERPQPALEFTLPSGNVLTKPRKASTDVWDKIEHQRDQPEAGVVEVDPWLNKAAQGAAPATEKPVAEPGEALRPAIGEKKCKCSRTYL